MYVGCKIVVHINNNKILQSWVFVLSRLSSCPPSSLEVVSCIFYTVEPTVLHYGKQGQNLAGKEDIKEKTTHATLRKTRIENPSLGSRQLVEDANETHRTQGKRNIFFHTLWMTIIFFSLTLKNYKKQKQEILQGKNIRNKNLLNFWNLI